MTETAVEAETELRDKEAAKVRIGLEPAKSVPLIPTLLTPLLKWVYVRIGLENEIALPLTAITLIAEDKAIDAPQVDPSHERNMFTL